MCQRTENKGDESLTSPDVQGRQREQAQEVTRIECTLRAQIREYVPTLEKCIGMTKQQCGESKLCQLGAQQQGKCGIDEEKLVVSLIGEANMDHPLVQVTVDSDHCSAAGENSCEVDEKCKWNGYSCDIKEERMFAKLLEHPQLLRLLRILQTSSFCHAYYESEQECPGETCRLEFGICRANHTHDKNPAQNLHNLMQSYCRSLPAESCLSPCVNNTPPGGEAFCRVPADLPPEFYQADMDRKDWYILGLMLQLNSATFMNERECNFLDDNETECGLSNKVCGSNDNGIAHRPPTIHEPTSGNPETGDLAIGLDGVVGKIVAAANSGKVQEKLDDLLKEDPHALEKVGQGLVAGFGKLVQSSEGTTTTAAKIVEEPAAESQLFNYVPLLLIVCALIVAAASAGIAGGTLCSFTMRRQRDTRLLAGEETMAEYDAAPLGANRYC